MNYKLIGLSPDNLKSFYTGDAAVDQNITAAGYALRVALEAGERLEAEAAALKANKDLSASGRMKKFRETEPRVREAALQKLGAARQQISARMDALKRRISVPPTPDDEGARRESNLVSAIRSMNHERRHALLDEIDDEIAAAILLNHPLALGMTAAEQEMVRLKWQKKKFPIELAALERESSILGFLQRGESILDKFSEELMLSFRQLHIAPH